MPQKSLRQRIHQRKPLIASARAPLLVAQAPQAPVQSTESRQQQKAVSATIWSFVATFAFATCVVLPYKGKQATLDFITG